MKTFEQFILESEDTSVEHHDRGLNTHYLVVKKRNAPTAKLHPEHLKKLQSLGDGETTKFKDKQHVTWHAKRDNGEFHINATPKFHPENSLKFPIHHAD